MSDKPRVHELKTWPEFFEAVFTGKKTFEVRYDDRGFKAGDVLHLKEWEPTSMVYTGRDCMVVVGYVLAGPCFGVAQNYVVLGFEYPEIATLTAKLENIKKLANAAIEKSAECAIHDGATAILRDWLLKILREVGR